jgi:HAE1 family hydrophobic/amphiphilic exporter-1
MIAWSVRRPAVVWAACATFLTAGGVAFSRLALATKTTVELPRLGLSASWPGASPELMEMYVTAPLESAVQSVRDVKRVESTSSDFTSRLTIYLEPQAHVQYTRLAIMERLEVLKREMEPGIRINPVANYVPDALREPSLLTVRVTGPYTPGALQKTVEEVIMPRLSAVPGVGAVGSGGGTDFSISVNYNPSLLRQLNIPPEYLTDAVRNTQTRVEVVGQERRGPTTQAVVFREQLDRIEDLGNIPVRSPSGRVFRLSELASVRAEEDAGGRFYRIDGQPALGLTVSREAKADAIRTARDVRAAMEALKPQLPPGLQLRVVSDESINLKKELDDLTKRGAIAFGAVLLVLAFLLFDAYAVFLVMGSTAVALGGTALSLYILKIPANMLTLAGLGMGVGILVQDALIVANRLRGAPPTPDGRITATGRIAPAVVGSTLTTAVVLFPFMYLQGNARAAFMPFASAFLLALAWSVITAITVVPALAASHKFRRWRWRLGERVYAWMVGWTLRLRPLTLLLTVAALSGLTWVFIKKIPRFTWGGGFGQQQTTLRVGMTFPRGSDPEALNAAMKDFEAIVGTRPEIEQVVTSGSGMGASMNVIFTSDGALTAVPLQLQEELTQRAVFIGGATISVQGQGPGFSAGMGGSMSSTFRLRVLGYSYTGVENLANDLKARLEQIPRVRDVNTNLASMSWGAQKGYAITLEPDRDALGRFGLTSQQFGLAASREMRSMSNSIRTEIGGEELPIMVKAEGSILRTLDDLKASIIGNARGAPVRVEDLALVSEREALANIERRDQQYVRIVSYDFRGPAKLAQRTHNGFMASIQVPAGYSVAEATYSWGAEDESTKGLWLVFGIGIALVILSVALVFDSAWAAAIVFLSLPLPLGGVIAAFWWFGAAFTREAAVGVILVIGIAVNQAILLTDAALQARRRHAAAGVRKSLDAGAVLRAALDRSGMILIVTITALASLLPLSIGTPTTSLFGAIALATAGGTLAGTLGTMFVMPALIFGRRASPRRGGWRRWFGWLRVLAFWKFFRRRGPEAPAAA